MAFPEIYFSSPYENDSDSDGGIRSDPHVPKLRYSVFQLIGDVIGMFRSLVRISVITTGLIEHFKWERYSFFVIELLILYTSSAMQVNRQILLPYSKFFYQIYN